MSKEIILSKKSTKSKPIVLEGGPYRVSDKACMEIEGVERRQAQVIRTAHLYWFD